MHNLSCARVQILKAFEYNEKKAKATEREQHAAARAAAGAEAAQQPAQRPQPVKENFSIPNLVELTC